jgi:hypothetical protein
MKNILIYSFFFISSSLHSQNYSFRIEEDYSKTTSTLFNAADEFQTNSIENGMYVSKAARNHAQIDFPYALRDRQKDCYDNSDMEYTIVKLKGNKEDFICVQVDPEGVEVSPYLLFQYNELGEWKLTNYRMDVIFSSGKVKVNPANEANVIKIEHRKNIVRYFINNQPVTEYKPGNKMGIRWYNNKVYSKNQKFILGLDKLVLKGCITDEVPTVKNEVYVTGQPSLSDQNEKAETKIAAVGTTVNQTNEKSDKVNTDLLEFTITQNERQLYGLKNSAGLIVLPANYGFIRWVGDYGLVGHPTNIEGTGIIDKQGKVIIDPSKYCDIQLSPNGSDLAVFVNGFAKVVICKDNGNLYGFVDRSGKEVVAPQYVRVGEFINGAAEVEMKDGTIIKIDTFGKRK